MRFQLASSQEPSALSDLGPLPSKAQHGLKRDQHTPQPGVARDQKPDHKSWCLPVCKAAFPRWAARGLGSLRAARGRSGRAPAAVTTSGREIQVGDLEESLDCESGQALEQAT